MPVDIVSIAYFLGQEMIDLDAVVSGCSRVFSVSIIRVCSLLLVGHSPTASSLDAQVLTKAENR